MQFSKAEIEFMKEIGIQVKSFINPSASDLIFIESSISKHLQEKGFDAAYSPTEAGKMCENILDKL